MKIDSLCSQDRNAGGLVASPLAVATQRMKGYLVKIKLRAEQGTKFRIHNTWRHDRAQ